MCVPVKIVYRSFLVSSLAHQLIQFYLRCVDSSFKDWYMSSYVIARHELCAPEEGVVLDAALPQVLARRLRLALEGVGVLLLVAVFDADHEHLAFERHLVQTRPVDRCVQQVRINMTMK